MFLYVYCGYHYAQYMCCILCVCINVVTLYCIYDMFSLMMEHQIWIRHCLICQNYSYKCHWAGNWILALYKCCIIIIKIIVIWLSDSIPIIVLWLSDSITMVIWLSYSITMIVIWLRHNYFILTIWLYNNDNTLTIWLHNSDPYCDYLTP